MLQIGQFAMSQLPERFKSKYDTDYRFVGDGKGKRKQVFTVKGIKDSPEFDSLKSAHRYIATLETGQLAEYIHRKYSHYGYKTAKCIGYGPEFDPHDDENRKRVMQRYDRYRWMENVTGGSGAGLRYTGKAGDIIRLGHTGWYTDHWQNETVYGEVYQMPARDGKPVYIPAVNDPDNDGCACLDFTSTTSDKEDAARLADQMAEQWADRVREYRAEEDRKQRLEEIQEEMKREYLDFRRIAKEIRASCDRVSGVQVVRELVQREWKRTKAEIHRLRAERARVEEYGIEY